MELYFSTALQSLYSLTPLMETYWSTVREPFWFLTQNHQMTDAVSTFTCSNLPRYQFILPMLQLLSVPTSLPAAWANRHAHTYIHTHLEITKKKSFSYFPFAHNFLKYPSSKWSSVPTMTAVMQQQRVLFCVGINKNKNERKFASLYFIKDRPGLLLLSSVQYMSVLG